MKYFICETCGKKFVSEYYEGGYIDHNNWTNNHNMKVGVNRGIDYICKNLDMRDDNECNIKDRTISNQLDLITCQKIWLKNNGYNNIVSAIEKYFENKELLLQEIFKSQPEFRKYFDFYVISQNRIIDFYKKHNLKDKEYKFIEVKDESYHEHSYYNDNKMIGILFNGQLTILKSDK